MADESCYGVHDLERIIRLGAADLVNVKLAKCGSLTVGRALLRRAEEAGLGTIVGSMMESHIGVGAAAALVAAQPTTETPDLDAAWWSLASPVVGGITYSGNEIRMPSDPGSGIAGWATAGCRTRSGGEASVADDAQREGGLAVARDPGRGADRAEGLDDGPGVAVEVADVGALDAVEVDEEHAVRAAHVAEGRLEGVGVAEGAALLQRRRRRRGRWRGRACRRRGCA